MCYFKQSLTISMMDKNFSRCHFEIFSYFFKKTGLDISCTLFLEDEMDFDCVGV